MDKYLISIIIPVYNVENHLEHTLKSIEEQTIGLGNLEVILIDDCSTDNSKEIIKQYAAKYENFKGAYHQVGSGFPGKPRNTGLEICTSKYIMFLDADDYLELDACEKLYNKITETNADIVSGSYTSLDADYKESLDLPVWINTLTNPAEVRKNRVKKTKKLLSNPNFELVVTDLSDYPSIIGNYNVWGKIFKRSLIDEYNIKFPEGRVAQDSVFLLEAFYNAKKIVFIKDIMVHYNNRRSDSDDSSISHVKNPENVEGRISAYYLMYNLSKKHGYIDYFVKYMLFQKLNFWFKNHLLNVDVDDYFLYDLFYNYQILFRLCLYSDVKISKDIHPIFEEISENNFDKAIEKFKELK